MQVEQFKKHIFSLSERLYPMVARILGSESLAKDAIQEIMIKLWNQRERLIGHPNLNGYVFLTARNYCLDQIKSKKPKYLSEEFLPATKGTAENEILEFQEFIDIVQDILKKSPLKHREILILRDIDGLEYEEIAAVTDLKVSHIRVLLSRARKYVQQELIRNFQYEYGGRK
ncbi:MAG: RNA polymerase sigma factor (sigma-70 family) [Saprospiraceae bacterium]|jgi:RNA polymerase sigma factor (sigma-70 family)